VRALVRPPPSPHSSCAAATPPPAPSLRARARAFLRVGAGRSSVECSGVFTSDGAFGSNSPTKSECAVATKARRGVRNRNSRVGHTNESVSLEPAPCDVLILYISRLLLLCALLLRVEQTKKSVSFRCFLDTHTYTLTFCLLFHSLPHLLSCGEFVLIRARSRETQKVILFWFSLCCCVYIYKKSYLKTF
jgi:hypothetical protein